MSTRITFGDTAFFALAGLSIWVTLRFIGWLDTPAYDDDYHFCARLAELDAQVQCIVEEITQ